MKRKKIPPSLLLVILAVISLALFYEAVAYAHRVNVFAWVNGKDIVVEARFGKNRPAINAEVKVMDEASNAQLLSGKTDETGVFVFPAPKVAKALDIQVNAGEGHVNRWRVDASELSEAGSERLARASTGKDASAQEAVTAPAVQTSGNALVASEIAEAAIRKIVHEELAREIAPIRRTLAMKSEDTPSFTEIIGGIGWIMGLVGLVLYFTSRKQKC